MPGGHVESRGISIVKAEIHGGRQQHSYDQGQRIHCNATLFGAEIIDTSFLRRSRSYHQRWVISTR